MQMLSKIAVVAAFATTAFATAPEGSWGADGQWTTCTDEEGNVTTSPAEAVTTPASTPAPYETPSSYAAPPTSSTLVHPVGSSEVPAPSSYAAPPSSSPVSPVSSAPAPSGTPEFPACWSTCFAENGNPSEDELCGNTAVSDCIKSGCEESDAAAYEGWMADYCGVSSSSTPVGPTGSSSVPATSYPVTSSYPAESSSTPYSPESSSAPPPSSYPAESSSTPYSPESSSKPYPTGSYPAESSSTPASPETSSKPYPTGSASSSTPYSPTGTPNMPSCWNVCFDKNGVTSKDALCGNAGVGECIKETCSEGEVSQYKGWLAEFCAGGSGSGVSSVVVQPTGSSSTPPKTVTTDVTTVYTTTCPASSEVTSDNSVSTSYYTTVSTVTTTYQTTKTVPGDNGPTSSPGSPVGPSSYPVSTVVDTQTQTYTSGDQTFTKTTELTSTIFQTSVS